MNHEPLERLIKQGKGWRIGWNPQAEIYRGLVGTDDWAIELTEAELDDFCRLINQLVQTMAQMQTQLMDEEKIACEAETDLLWMEVSGYPYAYDLRLILNRHRCFEGSWQSGEVEELAAACQNLKAF
jgi:hypothetical protein